METHGPKRIAFDSRFQKRSGIASYGHWLIVDGLGIIPPTSYF